MPGRINGGVANYLTLGVRGCARCWCRTALGAVAGAGSPGLAVDQKIASLGQKSQRAQNPNRRGIEQRGSAHRAPVEKRRRRTRVQLDNNPLRGRSACHVAVCVSAWCQRSPVCLPGASWAPTLGTVSIWLSTGACCVPVTPPPLSDCCSWAITSI